MKIIILPGDGIGPEVMAEAQKCLELISRHCDLDLEFEPHDFGGAAIERHGSPLPQATLDACRSADAILLGAVGGPQWSDCPETPEAGLLKLRAELGLFANLRPTRVIPGFEALSPLKRQIIAGADILLVRELTGGIYFGDHSYSDEFASDVCRYRRDEIEHVAHVAFKAARQRKCKLASIDKANVLATSKLWRRTVCKVAEEYPDVEVEHLYVDAAAMALVTQPNRFDVVLTENLFGDILSDELSVLSGSIGVLASASLGHDAPFLFEPVHGSAPDIAGLDVANPAGAILSAAMLLDIGLGLTGPAAMLENALQEALAGGSRTPDLNGSARCSEVGTEVRERLEARFQARDAHLELITMNRGCCG